MFKKVSDKFVESTCTLGHKEKNSKRDINYFRDQCK